MRKNWPFLLSCVLIVSILLSGMTGAMAAKSKKSANPETKLIAFTFDDGPGDYTEMLLDGLEERGAVATFFMTVSMSPSTSACAVARARSAFMLMPR